MKQNRNRIIEGVCVDYTYDGRNRLIGEGEPDSEIEYSYDDRDSITGIYYRRTKERCLGGLRCADRAFL